MKTFFFIFTGRQLLIFVFYLSGIVLVLSGFYREENAFGNIWEDSRTSNFCLFV